MHISFNFKHLDSHKYSQFSESRFIHGEVSGSYAIREKLEVFWELSDSDIIVKVTADVRVIDLMSRFTFAIPPVLMRH